MIVEKILDISSENFFQQIEKSILYDIKNATGMDIQNIEKGFKYSKILYTKLSKSSNVEIEILEYIYPSIYKVNFHSSKSVITIEYKANNITENQTKIIYTEEVEYFKKMNAWNFNIVSKFYIRKSKKKILMLLANIEHSSLIIT